MNCHDHPSSIQLLAMSLAMPTRSATPASRRLRLAPTWSCSLSCSSADTRQRIWCSSRRWRPHVVAAVETLAHDTANDGPAMLIGTPWVEDGKLCNAAALLESGGIPSPRFKVNLPNYGVFDEKRGFAPGPLLGSMSRAMASGMNIHSHCRRP